MLQVTSEVFLISNSRTENDLPPAARFRSACEEFREVEQLFLVFTTGSNLTRHSWGVVPLMDMQRCHLREGRARNVAKKHSKLIIFSAHGRRILESCIMESSNWTVFVMYSRAQRNIIFLSGVEWKNDEIDGRKES